MSIEVASGDSITSGAVEDQGSVGGYRCGSGIHVLTAPATVDRHTVTVIEDALTIVCSQPPLCDTLQLVLPAVQVHASLTTALSVLRAGVVLDDLDVSSGRR